MIDFKMNLLDKIAQQRATPPSAPAPRILGARYRRILFFFARLLAGVIWWEMILPPLGFRRRVERTRPARMRRIAAQFRALATRMGGVMIKVGQFLSARFDVLPPEIVAELAGLQDEVPTEDFARVRALAEAELGARLEEAFATFEERPLAAASLGQVHRATLKPEAGIPTGTTADCGPITKVVVKIQRPGIERAVETDLAALRRVAGWVQRYPEMRKRANMPALVDEFSATTRAELDYLAEGKNAETLARNLAKRPGICLPKVDWKHTTGRVLTLEDVYAIKINDYAAITAAGISRAAVAHRLFQSYLQQIFEDGFFHADPHPGNLFVQRLADGASGDGPVSGSQGWQLTFVDFGMVGQVSPTLRASLREMAIAVVAQDARRLVQAFQTMGMLLPGADLALLEKADARLFALFGGKSMSQLHQVDRAQMRQFFDEFGELMYNMPFQIPNDLLFLGRAMAILSGICSGLDPAFDMWKELEPFAQKLVAAEALPVGRQLLGEVGKLASSLVGLPGKVDRVLDQADRGELTARVPDLSRQVQRLEQGLNRLWGAIIFAALLLGGVQLELGGRHDFAIALLVGAGLALLWLIWPRRRFR